MRLHEQQNVGCTWTLTIVFAAMVVSTAYLSNSNRTFGDETKLKVVVSTDCGVEVDDQWALLHLALSPKIDLRGVLSTHAPKFPAPSSEATANLARKTLSFAPSGRRPKVLPGEAYPLAELKSKSLSQAARFLIEESRGCDPENRLTVVMIGPATDVALALEHDPGFANRARIVAMAFDSWPRGKDPWNVKNDPKAWRIVLESKIPLVVADASVSKSHLLMSSEKARKAFSGAGPGADFLIAELDSWLDQEPKMVEAVSGKAGVWPIWDESTVAYLLGLAKTKTVPRPKLAEDLGFDLEDSNGTIEWVTEIDEDRLWKDLARKLRDSR